MKQQREAQITLEGRSRAPPREKKEKLIRKAPTFRNIRWICIHCGATAPDEGFTDRPKDPAGVPLCECGEAGWYMDADLIQAGLGGARTIEEERIIYTEQLRRARG